MDRTHEFNSASRKSKPFLKESLFHANPCWERAVGTQHTNDQAGTKWMPSAFFEADTLAYFLTDTGVREPDGAPLKK